MKYIRTKEELGIERDDGTCCFKTWVAHANSPLKKDWLYADTIEELCDAYVMVDLDKESTPTFDTCKISLQNGYEINEEYAIYGAIWTDKGLIYVAKMNDKGELELL